jgi:hypothetical protein
MSALEENSLFCFSESLNVSRDEVEGYIEIRRKTNYFPREQTLSVLLYSEKQKSTLNTTIIFRDKNSIV